MGAGTGLYIDMLLESLKLFAARHGYSCYIEESFEKLEQPLHVVVCRDRFGVSRKRFIYPARGARRRLFKAVDLELQALATLPRMASAQGVDVRLTYRWYPKLNIVMIVFEEDFRGWVEAVGIVVKVVAAQVRKYGEKDLRRWFEQMRGVVAKHFRGMLKKIFYAVYAPTTRFYFDRRRYRSEEEFLRRNLYGYGAKLYRSFRELVADIFSFWVTRLERLRESIERLRFRVYGRVEKLVKWLETAVKTLESFWSRWLSRPPPIEDSRRVDTHALLYLSKPIPGE